MRVLAISQRQSRNLGLAAVDLNDYSVGKGKRLRVDDWNLKDETFGEERDFATVGLGGFRT